ncbi:hypothetical protein DNX69_17835 [Rhodopseudomonas palustris]|uniref:Uncharacterized protein n=1 Tax=Rhodopseudomonas palustris TaxID=1076 RepID=A0A323UUB8_RHOPL|nr:hypothetical protein DNX69_17835 [Rhodopseudomonas palustris]
MICGCFAIWLGPIGLDLIFPLGGHGNMTNDSQRLTVGLFMSAIGWGALLLLLCVIDAIAW